MYQRSPAGWLWKTEYFNKEIKRLTRVVEDIVGYAIEKNIDDPVQFVKNSYGPGFEFHSLEKLAANQVIKTIITIVRAPCRWRKERSSYQRQGRSIENLLPHFLYQWLI